MENLDVYTDYLAKKEIEQQQVAKEVKQEKPKAEKPKSEKKKLSFKEQKEWETISDDIAKMEEKIMQTEEEISKAGSDFTKLQQLTGDLETYNSEYEQLIERWSYLDEIVNG